MVQIPNDIGLRMRLQAEAQLLQATSPVAEIPTDLPDLRPGQRFTARILEALPENTFKAVVAGKTLTLSLPESAKAGDTLDLVVVDRSTRALIAQSATPSSVAEGAEAPLPYQFTQVSRTGQMIASLLADPEMPATPVQLSRGAPIQATAPPSDADAGAALAEALGRAVQRSGLFYESHQAQWLSGSYPLARLLEEPQAQHSNFATLVTRLLQGAAGADGGMGDAAVPATSARAESEAQSAPHSTQRQELQIPMVRSASAAASDETRTAPVAGTTVITAAPESELPGELKSLLQQQLDVGATQRMIMHGELWPQQTFQWEVERDARHAGPQGDSDPNWTTQLALTMPMLGTVGARLQIAPEGVRITLMAQSPETSQRLRSHAGELNDALQAAGLQLIGMHVLGGDSPISAHNA